MVRQTLLSGAAALLFAAPAIAQQPSPTSTTDAVAADMEGEETNRSEALAGFFQQYDQAKLALSPLGKSYRGIRDDSYAEWGEYSDASEELSHQIDRAALAAMRESFDRDDLSEADALSYRLFESSMARSDSLYPYRKYGYVFDQMNGAQSGLPAFLINIHRVSNEREAQAYVSRIAGLGEVMTKLTAESRDRAEKGVMPPDWVYPYVLSDIDNMLGQNNPILEDVAKKVNALDLSDARKAELISAAGTAWASEGRPSYLALRAEMLRQQKIAPTEDGIWRFDEGADYYAALLKNYTTTDLSADQIHDLGLQNVARIHGEMRGIMEQVGFTGSLQDFFKEMRTNPKYYYDTREAYLADVQTKRDAMTAALPGFFNTLPKADLEVKPVEAFREKSAGKAFYSRPAPDGSRPGIYYVNLYNLEDMSKNELEALFYHEGLPGHHLQLAVQTELEGIPPFRQFGGVTAYSEGWGLYSEALGKDMGFYTDPYSDFGRLGMELWRAARLVVDTGLHHKRWSREKAIDYLKTNTPNPDGDIRKAIERYAVYPGQATAYMIGKLKIMELRQRAMDQLGDGFDYGDFHDVVLKSGPVPLDVLEENVDAWLAARAG